ncbi:MAG: acetate kinase [Candidatus Falkowbacteria bacterium]
MPNTLVLNAGSTSIKYKLFDEVEKELAQGQVNTVKDYPSSFKQILRQVIKFGEISLVGHRVVHGGWRFTEPTIIGQTELADLAEFNHLAPLHNPYNFEGIKVAMEFLPESKNVAVFDTGFFAELPDEAKTYAIPNKVSEQYHLRRYGFHGISHNYAMLNAAEIFNIKLHSLNLISVHLGGGCSVAAIKRGKAIDISNGFTPNEGLIMMSRSGDIDSGLVLELLRLLPGTINAEKVEALNHLLNYESGIKGLSPRDHDFVELLRSVSLSQSAATRAFNLFVYRIVKYVGAYWAVLGGDVDGIVFTGAIGAGQAQTRNAIMRRLKFLSGIPTIVIKPNEELLIARQARTIV